MKYNYSEFQQAIKNLHWSKQELADRLSVIGHETEVTGEELDVTVTSNRKDCQNFQYLVFDLCGVTEELEQSNPPSVYSHSNVIPVSIEQVNRLLGSNLEPSVLKKLEKLGFIVETNGVRPPDFRTGIETVADIAEEVLRVVGFEAISIKELPKTNIKVSPDYEKQLAIKQKLADIGLFETRTYSFESSGDLELKNPFSATTPYLRTSLIQGLLVTASKNPFMKRVSCFEIGNVFNPDEQTVLGVLLTGQKNYDHAIQQITKVLGVTITFQPVEDTLLTASGVKQPNPVSAQLPIDKITEVKPTNRPVDLPQFQPVSKFPPLVRDVTLIDAEFDSSTAAKIFPELLFVEEIDNYVSPETNKQSVTYRFLFQKFESSFVDEEIRSIDQRLLKHFNNE